MSKGTVLKRGERVPCFARELAKQPAQLKRLSSVSTMPKHAVAFTAAGPVSAAVESCTAVPSLAIGIASRGVS